MLISLVGTLTQARMGVGRAIFLSKGTMRGQYFFLVAKYMFFFLWTFSISNIISADTISYFLKMSMLISLVGTLTQTRMGIDRLIFYS